MDESCRITRRRSTEETPSSYILERRPISETLNPNFHYKGDFSDVFGGPPRTLHLSRTNFLFQDRNMFSARTDHHHHNEYVYDDVSRQSHVRSTNSKSSSSSSADLSSPPYSISQHFRFGGKQCTKRNCDVNARMVRLMMSSNNLGFSRRVLSPERDLDCFKNLKQAVDDYELFSPPSSSAKSSICHEDQEVIQSTIDQEDCLMPDDNAEEDDDDDFTSSYVIEINDFNCDELRPEETVEAVGVDEAIAWAKEKYQSGIQLAKYQSTNHHPVLEVSASSHMQMDEDLVSSSPESDSIPTTTENGIIEMQIDEEQRAMEVLGEGIKLWSAYKETNIQLLLSTLHHILWSSSGWTAVSLADIIDSSQVKKAYQKARLCLHPDKLQQRGATPLQKYIAAEAFSVLQAAWEAFISRNTF